MLTNTDLGWGGSEVCCQTAANDLKKLINMCREFCNVVNSVHVLVDLVIIISKPGLLCELQTDHLRFVRISVRWFLTGFISSQHECSIRTAD